MARQRPLAGAAAGALVLGLLAAIGVVSMGLLGGARVGSHRTELATASASAGHGAVVGVRGRMAGAIASAQAGAMGIKLEEVGGDAEAEIEEGETTNSTGNSTNATNATAEEVPCTSWRGCFKGTGLQGLPSDIRFECGGEDAAETCYSATRACVRSAETSLANMYVVSPILGTESTGNAVCKCFVSNGCKPRCNVAMYQSESLLLCMICTPQIAISPVPSGRLKKRPERPKEEPRDYPLLPSTQKSFRVRGATCSAHAALLIGHRRVEHKDVVELSRAAAHLPPPDGRISVWQPRL